MTGRVVEIAEDGRHLAKSRGFLTVNESGTEIGRIALDDIAAVIATAHGITYSNNLLVALAERCAPLVVCAANFRPAAVLWPADGHHDQAGRMADQAGAGKAIKKRLWPKSYARKFIVSKQPWRRLAFLRKGSSSWRARCAPGTRTMSRPRLRGVTGRA